MEKTLAYIALFAALIAVLGIVPPLSLGFGVPITAQSLGIMLAGSVLGAKRGTAAVLLFLFTTGGVTLGNCATGRACSESQPIRVISRAITIARRGRSTKR